ncbi:MAG: hypothetical protein WC551_12030 [Patescibacteria group bacterium]
MKKTMLIVGALLLAGTLLGVFAFAGDGRVDIYSDGLRVATTGTKVNMVVAGSAEIANGTTSKAVTSTGVAVGDLVIVGLAQNPSSASKAWGIATTNTVTLYVNTDPGTTITLNYLAVGKE